MIDAGLPLVECLTILGRQEDNADLRETILDVRVAVEGGTGLEDAMRRHPKTFDGLYTAMITAGEAGGVLDTILKRLAVVLEKNVKLRSQVSSAMMYPMAVLVIAALVVGAILWKVIPTFSTLFEGLGAMLPPPTRFVIWMSDSFVAFLPTLLVGAGVTVLGLRRFYATHRGRRVVDGILLRLPVLGIVLRKMAVARFCRTLATLLGSGVAILEGLKITAKTARDAIERGESVAGPLRDTNVFPIMVTQMVNIGETTGALDVVLEKIADFYEEEVDAAVGGMLTLLEPIMIAFLGVVIGGIVVAMYMPIFELISRMAS